MHRTRSPSSANAPARLIAVVVLPTPPFWLAIAITLRPQGITSDHRQARRAVQCGSSGDVAMLPQRTVRGHAGYPHGSELFTISVDNCGPYDGLRPCTKTGVCSGGSALPTDQERSARLDALRAESLLGGGQEQIDQQHARGS